MTRIRVRRAVAAATLLVLCAATNAVGQERPTNLQVLPDSIARGELIAIMRGFSTGLGVRCTHCHVEVERDGESHLDFAADDRSEKRVAREMMRMVAAINERLALLPERAEPPVRVQCATCHRGAATPRLLGDTLLVAYDAGGRDALLATYRDLRERHHGRSAYDFGPLTLADVGAELMAREMPADAVLAYRLNLESHPNDVNTHMGLGAAELATGDSAAALAAYRRVLELDATNRRAAEMVRTLSPSQR